MDARDRKIERSLIYSIADGSFHAAMLGFGESFFAAFAVFLGANNIHLALLGSLPALFGSVSQFFTNRFIGIMKTRKALVSGAALAQALMHVPVLLVFFLGDLSIETLILFVCIYYVFGMILGPAWNSWMGDLVDENRRGAYFGRRSKITGFATTAATFTAGYILHSYSGGRTYEYTGFIFIFLIAMIFRVVSFSFLRKKYEPPYESAPKAEFTFLEFIREARFRNYGRFVIYLCFMNFSVHLSAPFIVPYLLKDLRFDYMIFTLIMTSALIVKFLAMPVWGRASDQFGTKKVLTLSGFLMPLVPLLWVFSGNVYYLIVIQLYSGFIWAGFEISSFNFVFDTTSPRKRATGVAYYNVLNGVCVFAGAVAGGLMVRYNELFWSKYYLVFIASSVLRYTASILFIPRLREVRTVEQIGLPRLFFKIVSTLPTVGPVYSLIPFGRKQERKD